MDKNAKTVPLTKGPTDSGGGPSITGKETGKLEPGMKSDYEDMCFEKPEEDITNEDLSSWLFEYWGNLDSSVGKLATVVEKMCTFSLATRNLHKEMKGWCIELHKQMGRVQKRSEALKSFVDKSSDRIVDLSSSLLEVSTTHSLRAVSTADIGVGTETEAVLKPRSSDEQDTGQQTSSKTGTNQGHGRQRRHLKTTKLEKTIQEERGNVPERKKKKSKMKPGNKNTHVAPSQGVTISKGKGASTYADMVKKLKDEIDLETIGVEIKSVKRTKEDGIFMFVGKGTKAAEDVKKLKREIENVLGGDVVVKESSRPPLIEIRGIGQEEKEEDVVSGICRYGTIPEEVHVTKMGPSFGATQRALVSVSAEIAGKIIATGRVLVGLISCGVRLKGKPVIRCYRCHGYNHRASTCRGHDRRNLCMTCGGEGHLAKLCRSAPNCVLCKDIKRQADHYPGSGRCEAYRKARLK
ncbi:unnamed protein product [Macrosiphum euphorbiae]|uniref:CCHC-type domain-containing protein n=1 Tax=Macrosiphum euphorbiae TaxID=13131 RepID=A0AAV0Y3Q4_9HEMI|nr:unnamed protein product [Macrosiphum euphorbiae]